MTRSSFALLYPVASPISARVRTRFSDSTPSTPRSSALYAFPLYR